MITEKVYEELDKCINKYQCLIPTLITDMEHGARLFDGLMNYTHKPANSLQDERCKGRLCFDGSQEEEGIDYHKDDCPAPGLRTTAFRCALSM